MIFITVGTQLPFDRLIEGLDNLPHFSNNKAFAQIGKGSRYIPKEIEYKENLSQTEFQEAFENASIIISHAGIGTILTAQRLNKPLIVFPRISTLKEHRNDHQISTTKQLKDIQGIYPAKTIDDIKDLLERNLTPPSNSHKESLKKLQMDINTYAK